MKTLLSALIVVFALTFVSCSDSLDSQAKKMAHLSCELESLYEQSMSLTDEAEVANITEKIEQINKEMQELGKILEEKYNEDLEAQKIFIEAMEKYHSECTKLK